MEQGWIEKGCSWVGHRLGKGLEAQCMSARVRPEKGESSRSPSHHPTLRIKDPLLEKIGASGTLVPGNGS